MSTRCATATAAFSWLRGQSPATITSSLPSGSVTRHRFPVTSSSRPPAASVAATSGLGEVRRHRELDVDPVALQPPLGLRGIQLLEHQHRVQPPRIEDVGDAGSMVLGVSESCDPERTDDVDVGSIDEELDEACQLEIRSRPELASDGLEPACEVDEIEIEAVRFGFGLVLATVEDHEPRPHIDHQGKARRAGPVPLLQRRVPAAVRAG